MFGLLDGLKIGAGAILGAGLILGPAYLYGKSAGKTEAATAALQKSIEVMRERSATDDEISRSDLAGMCAYLGLLEDDQRECMRRLAQADHEP
ncbi:hypothetical protein [Shinella sumterensis]|uniref:hypothetical protein n=1 Tax=Shinella sumterensis TaxID=1967501 RepID=UPI001E55AFB4|nr:hypothetical protein [Shinella sumterensis]